MGTIHEIFQVVGFEIVGPFILHVEFDDGSSQEIDFRPVLAGEMYGPLQDLDLFNQVRIESDFHTLVWPNDADFDPETLRNWPRYKDEMIRTAQSWALAATR